MDAYRIFETEHWLVSHRRDARYPGYLIASSRAPASQLQDLDANTLQELGPVLQRVEHLLQAHFSPCKVIFYKLGFSSGFSCHFHVAPITQKLLDEIASHPDYPSAPDGNDAILFLSREYCERQLTPEENARQQAVVQKLRDASIPS